MGTSAARKDGNLGLAKAKEILKENVSEYFLYTVEGRDTIANGWSKRMTASPQRSRSNL